MPDNLVPVTDETTLLQMIAYNTGGDQGRVPVTDRTTLLQMIASNTGSV